MKVSDLQSIIIKLASPEKILEWSHGEVKKPETINYRTQRPEKDGLFCERIFGPTKDYECYCGKYKGIRFKGIVCDRCGVEVTRSDVRRERMGHIKLASPVSHIWFLRSVPSRIGMMLDVSQQKLERVIYFVNYIIEDVDEKAKKSLLDELAEEFSAKKKKIEKSPLSEKEKAKEKEALSKTYFKTKEEISSIKPLQIISEIEYQNLSLKYGEIFSAGMGAETLLRIFKKINLKQKIKELEEKIAKTPVSERKKLLRKLKFMQGMEYAGIKPEWMFLQVLPVLPPDLRSMVQLEGGRYASSDLNDLYRRVINRNNRLKYLLEISAPEAIVRNEKRMLQEAVDSLLDNKMRKAQMTTASTGGKRLLKSLADILSGKQGRFRRNLLGKRVDYSGRSVIASGPELKIPQCGLPKLMALELFKPFIIKKLLEKELAYNIRGASRMIDEREKEVFTALEEVVKDKLVLLNRAPTLHRLGIQAFEPVLIEGEAIRLHPLVCKAFNADFDGDQMAVHVPLSKEAQDEARNLMIFSKNLLKPATGLPIVAPTLDIVLGSYWMTSINENGRGTGKYFSSGDEAITAYRLGKVDLRAAIKVYLSDKIIETTVGRVLFNRALPESFEYINESVTSKKLSKIVGEVIKNYPEEKVIATLDKIKDLGFEFATLSGITLGMDDFIVPDKKKDVIKEKEKEADQIEKEYQRGFLSLEEKEAKIIEIWQDAKREIEELVIKTMPEKGPIATIVNSGARGSWAQPVQICGMKGLVNSPSGKIIQLPVKDSFKEGFDVLEFFISTHGARKGTVDTALRTAASGYLTRRLVDVSHEVIVNEEDCGDTTGLEIYRKEAESISQDFVFKIVGRVVLDDVVNPKTKKKIVGKGEEINWQKAKEIDEAKVEKVRVRTPLTCKAKRGVCQKCYGWEMGRNKMVELGDAVGIIASQSIGEPGTQLTMRTFHLGGVAGGGDITRGLPRVEEILELRNLKEEGVVSAVDGKVNMVDLENGEIIINPIDKNGKVNTKKSDEIKYIIPAKSEVYVQKGDKVSVGQVLSSGPLDLRKLFKLSGKEAVQKYIIREIQKIYVGEGINIHDKHIEVIVRQMFSRVKIIDPGDSLWISEEIVSRAEFEEKQEELKSKGKKLAKAKPVILAISKVSLNSESFLSAASFQETSKVLIKASLEGREDKLKGLKENVMIGRIIPAGTGFRKKRE